MLGDLIARGAGHVAVQDGDVVGVHAEQLEGGVPVGRDVGGDRLEAQAVVDRSGHQGFVLEDQYAHVTDATSACVVGVSESAYGPATDAPLDWVP
nr:hypothetical protein GCM10025699_77100 [Microbacterium flavescens]